MAHYEKMLTRIETSKDEKRILGCELYSHDINAQETNNKTEIMILTSFLPS